MRCIPPTPSCCIRSPIRPTNDPLALPATHRAVCLRVDPNYIFVILGM
jgi:hypothetical protein